MKHLNLQNILVIFGLLLLFYAILGNYVALPGYIRFLERGGRSASGSEFDLAVLIGAIKTIFWMYSFQLGILLLAILHSMKNNLKTTYITIGGLLWITLWSIPKLPQPGAWFYLIFGSLILIMIVLILVDRQLYHHSNEQLSKTLALGSLIFFAYAHGRFADWEVQEESYTLNKQAHLLLIISSLLKAQN
jgi:hypothetical protein